MEVQGTSNDLPDILPGSQRSAAGGPGALPCGDAVSMAAPSPPEVRWGMLIICLPDQFSGVHFGTQSSI